MGPEGARFIIPAVELQRASRVPLPKQIAMQMSRAIRSGRLPGGVRVPSTRMLAKLLQVSRNTAVAAYEELAAEGLLELSERMRPRVMGTRPRHWLSPHGLRSVARAAHYPVRTQPFGDPDENALYLNLR